MRSGEKKHDPPRNRPAADPLVIMWESASLAKTVSVLLAFRTMDSPMDMLFLRLGPNVGLIEEPPFSLRVPYYADRLDAAPLHDNDLAICAQLALEAGDWVIHRLELAGIDDDPSEFRIARKISYDAEHLQEEARQQKENNLAMRAFRLMERLKSGQKRQRRPWGPQAAQRKRDNLPCLAMSKENFRLPVCLRRAGLKTVNGLAVPVKRTRTHGCPLI